MRDAELGGDGDDEGGQGAGGLVFLAVFEGRDGGRGDLGEDFEGGEWDGGFAGGGGVVGVDGV